jgi:hypothetical protein
MVVPFRDPSAHGIPAVLDRLGVHASIVNEHLSSAEWVIGR